MTARELAAELNSMIALFMAGNLANIKEIAADLHRDNQDPQLAESC